MLVNQTEVEQPAFLVSSGFRGSPTGWPKGELVVNYWQLLALLFSKKNNLKKKEKKSETNVKN